MVRCMFLGHRQYCLGDVLPNLQGAVERIVQENDAVEFLLYHFLSREPFYNLCLLAAAWAKQRNPQKVKVTLLVDHKHYDAFTEQGLYSIPLCLLDQVTPVILHESPRRDYSLGYRKMMRGMMEQSDYVISGIYEDLIGTEQTFLHLARNVLKRQIIDVTDSTVAQLISEGTASLSEREQAVFQMVKDGLSQREIANRIQLSTTRSQQIIHKTGSSLKEYAGSRFLSLRALGTREERPCGIFQTGPATDAALDTFGRYIRFLVERYEVETFYVDQDFVDSGFMAVLAQQIGGVKGRYRIIAVAADDAPLEYTAKPVVIDGDKQIIVAYTVEGAPGLDEEGRWGTAVHIMEQSVFCICDLSVAPDAQKIMAHIPRTKQAVILDLGGTAHAAEDS